MKQDVGTCPCCRKEMTATEDLPRDEASDSDSDDSDDDDSDDDYGEEEFEVPFDREKLGEFLKERGGVGMKDTISAGWDDATTVTFTRTQLHFLFIGNGAKPFTDEEWEAIIEDEDEDEDEAEEGEIPQSLRITIDDNSRTVMFTTFEDMALDAEAIAAATKVQSLWRAHKARETLMEKRVIHTLASLKTRNFLSA